MPRVTAQAESFRLSEPFRISRGVRTHAEVVVARASDAAGIGGRGECTPYARYGETVESVLALIREWAEAERADLAAMPAGAARNALDCALWDLEAKRTGEPVWRLAGLANAPETLRTVMTVSLDAPEAMEKAASRAVRAGRTLLKIKLGAGDGNDDERIHAVRRAAPGAVLVCDANEGWRESELERYLLAAREAGLAMVEQPLPAGDDAALDGVDRTLRGTCLLGADESIHTRRDLESVRGRYDVVNVKLDKAGGLTEALATAREARVMGLELMVGCMMATSLAMAPAVLVAQEARFVDLDGPLWMAEDREPGLRYDGERVSPPEPALWG